MHVPRNAILAVVLLTIGNSAWTEEPHRALKQEIKAWYARVEEAYKMRDGLADIPTVTDVCDVEVADGSIHKSKKAWLEWSKSDIESIESVQSGGVTVDRVESAGNPIIVVCTERWKMVFHDDTGYWGQKGLDHHTVWSQQSRWWLVRGPRGLELRKSRGLTKSETRENGKLLIPVVKKQAKS